MTLSSSSGKCTQCKTGDSAPGRRLCPRCAEYQKTKNRERRVASKKKGVCTNCGSPSSGTLLCATCSDAFRITRLNKRAERRALKRCTLCGDDLDKRSSVYCTKHYELNYVRQKRRRNFLKSKVFCAYGGIKCACCSEDILDLLTIDHVGGGGAKHRRDESIAGSLQLYKWIIKNKFPSGFEVVCFNCNCGRWYNNGVCPHKDVGRGNG